MTSLPLQGVGGSLTPSPMELTMREGSLRLKRGFTMAVADASLRPDAEAFARSVELVPKVTNKRKGTLVIQLTDGMEEEGYRLSVTDRQALIEVSTAKGLFYALQTVRRLLTEAGTLPCLTIHDAPRFPYRGFMLDCSRHFFTVDEIKHVLDGMAMYKLNYFHWHLTDDQGWRFEVKRYPRLTTVGATAPDCRWNDMEKGYYWLGKPYGPYFYTQEDCREVIRYADSLHIEVVPEIDMPGHFCAALAAYPEFSCNPGGQHGVQTQQGGVYADVLDVSNPAAVQFTKDVLTEVMDVFPGRYVHIGGDECPTSAWEQSAGCKTHLAQLITEGKTPQTSSFRPLQSYFTKQMADHIKARGRRIAVWNESITAGGSDLDMMRRTEATVFCWNPCQQGARLAAQIGLDCVITEWGPGCYYINRKQSNVEGEPGAAGNGSDNLERTFNYVPVPTDITPGEASHYIGLQATFWSEHVCDIHYVDYLCYPRLIAIAETAWSPLQKPGFEDFLRRFRADVPLLERRGFLYGKHYLQH